MARVLLTHHLARYFPGLPGEVEVAGGTAGEVVAGLEARWPGIAFYLVDERGRLREHVALFVDGRRVPRGARLGERVGPSSVVQIVQALSGG